MSGRLAVVGLGPGDAAISRKRRATRSRRRRRSTATGLISTACRTADQPRHPSDNREEAKRSQAALRHAADGAHVAIVSGGDPGVFAMAAAVCDEIERGPDAWRALDVAIVPGITAMLAVAARVGAPLGHDFCAISLSDNLKPWELIEQRLDAAAAGGFVIALYNPVSLARPWQLGEAFARLSRHLPPSTPVVFGRAVGRADEAMTSRRSRTRLRRRPTWRRSSSSARPRRG